MTFTDDMFKYNEKTRLLFDRVVQESVKGLTKELVTLTPHITGTARSNYFWSSDSPVNITSSSVSPSGDPSLQRAASFASQVKAGGVIYVSNSLFYISDLEFGTDGRAPHAMMRTAAAKWKQIGREAEERAMR